MMCYDPKFHGCTLNIFFKKDYISARCNELILSFAHNAGSKNGVCI